MIKVTIEKEGNLIRSFEMAGHANFDVHGKDLVCAGASAVSFGAINALFELTDIRPKIEQASDGGYLKVALLNEEMQNPEVQLIMNTMIVSLQTIEKDYGKYIKIIFK